MLVVLVALIAVIFAVIALITLAAVIFAVIALIALALIALILAVVIVVVITLGRLICVVLVRERVSGAGRSGQLAEAERTNHRARKAGGNHPLDEGATRRLI
jgi:hypothetical protein